MANIEISQHKLVLKQGSTTLTLDKDAGKATLQQRLLLWNKKPVEFALSDIDDIAVRVGQKTPCLVQRFITAFCTDALARSRS